MDEPQVNESMPVGDVLLFGFVRVRKRTGGSSDSPSELSSLLGTKMGDGMSVGLMWPDDTPEVEGKVVHSWACLGFSILTGCSKSLSGPSTKLPVVWGFEGSLKGL